MGVKPSCGPESFGSLAGILHLQYQHNYTTIAQKREGPWSESVIALGERCETSQGFQKLVVS